MHTRRGPRVPAGEGTGQGWGEVPFWCCRCSPLPPLRAKGTYRAGSLRYRGVSGSAREGVDGVGRAPNPRVRGTASQQWVGWLLREGGDAGRRRLLGPSACRRVRDRALLLAVAPAVCPLARGCLTARALAAPAKVGFGFTACLRLAGQVGPSPPPALSR